MLQRLRHVVPVSVRVRLSSLPSWSVGVYRGRSPLELQPVSGAAPLVLSAGDGDPSAVVLMADPFALRWQGRWHLFVEVVERGSRRGRIALATSDDLTTWTYAGGVLDEPYHLSYPFVFEHDGACWMVPETATAGQVRLYRATQFPSRWVLDTVLLRGAPYKDSSLVQHDGSWWMFTETSSRHTNDELRLFRSGTLQGPWREHPASPVVRHDPTAARPGGRPLVCGDRVLRFAQECGTTYGRQVGAYEVLMTRDRYEERLLDPAVLGPAGGSSSGASWNGAAMHHLDAHPDADGWVAFADGHS